MDNFAWSQWWYDGLEPEVMIGVDYEEPPEDIDCRPDEDYEMEVDE